MCCEGVWIGRKKSEEKMATSSSAKTELDEDLLEKARNELFETEETREEKVTELRAKIEKNKGKFIRLHYNM